MNSMMTTRLHRLGGPGVLSYEAVPMPVPQAGEALVRVEATGVNFADVVRRRGDPYPVPTPLPYTLGGECIGVVESVGHGVASSLLGQRMFAFPGLGCYASHVIAPVQRLFDVPQGLDPVTGVALFVQGLSAALVLKTAGRLAAGETVLVQGAAGGVGLLAVQLARLYGAGTVIGAASSKPKQDLVLAHGANYAVDYTAPAWGDEVRNATQGKGVDLVLEMTGGEVARQSLALLAPFGRSVVYGNASRTPMLVSGDDLPPRNLTVTGFFLRAYLEQRALIQSLLDELGTFVRDGRLKIHNGGVFALKDAALAHEALEARTSTGKLVLVP